MMAWRESGQVSEWRRDFVEDLLLLEDLTVEMDRGVDASRATAP